MPAVVAMGFISAFCYHSSMSEALHNAIREILTAGDFDRFLGKLEDLHFEAKGATPWNLATPDGQFELAKDVSALANAEGGFIIVGLTTTALPNERADQVTALELLAEKEFDAGKVSGLIREYLHPKCDDIEIRWYASRVSGSGGVAAIYVPAQAERRKPFIIKKVVDEGARQRAIVIGVAKRFGSDNNPLSVSELYDLLRAGGDPYTTRLARIEEKVDSLAQHARPVPSPQPDVLPTLRRRIDELMAAYE
jgi:hypothetical protein